MRSALSSHADAHTASDAITHATTDTIADTQANANIDTYADRYRCREAKTQPNGGFAHADRYPYGGRSHT